MSLAALAGLAIISVSVIRLSERPVVRGATGSEIKLIDPKRGEAITARDAKFRWEAVPKASRYIVDVFGPSLEKVLSSEAVSEPSLVLPADALRAFIAGETYFWRVRAFIEEGQEVVSKLSEFSIRR